MKIGPNVKDTKFDVVSLVTRHRFFQDGGFTSYLHRYMLSPTCNCITPSSPPPTPFSPYNASTPPPPPLPRQSCQTSVYIICITHTTGSSPFRKRASGQLSLTTVGRGVCGGDTLQHAAACRAKQSDTIASVALVAFVLLIALARLGSLCSLHSSCLLVSLHSSSRSS